MSRPDATAHDRAATPDELRALIERSGLTQRAAASALGISDRVMRYYLTGDRPAPYLVQYGLEQLAATAPLRTSRER